MSVVGNINKGAQGTQPSGIPQPIGTRGTADHRPGSDEALLAMHARLVELVPDVEARIAVLGVPANVDAAWTAGRMIPVLRARRKPLQTEVERLERIERLGK